MDATRREMLILARSGTLALAKQSAGFTAETKEPETEISAAEDLMREHGVMERTLLICEEPE